MECNRNHAQAGRSRRDSQLSNFDYVGAGQTGGMADNGRSHSCGSALSEAEHRHPVRRQIMQIATDVGPYFLPPSTSNAGGGGGGGDTDKLAASKGRLTQLSRQPVAPAAVIIRNENPKLPAVPTVLVPPEIHLPSPQNWPIGDLLSAIVAPSSNGTGSEGGIGAGRGGGAGSGSGPGVGPGSGGGSGGGFYRIGGGVTAPRLIYAPDPEFSEEARQAKYQGVVVLWAIVGTDGRTHDILVMRSLGMGLDEKAMDAIRRWRFEPGCKGGVPVAVQVNIEVAFRLF
jgi:periplasmic protein TonB